MKTLSFANGDQMPIIGLGTWNSAPNEVYNAVKEALRLGYQHIDCAAAYGNETEIGKALTESIAEGIVSRDQLWITSKLWNDSHGNDAVQPALEKTLADLQIDYLDLYLIHWPVAQCKGIVVPSKVSESIPLSEQPISETWQAMESCLDKGLCRHIGVSNFSVKKLKALVDHERMKPEMNQVEMHPYLQQPNLVSLCQDNNIHLTAYSPLGSPARPEGLKKADDPVLLEDPTIQAIAQGHGISPAQVLISWSMQRGIAVIPKSVTPARLQQNLDSVRVTLTDQDIHDINVMDKHRRYVVGDFWALPGSSYTVENLWDEGE